MLYSLLVTPLPFQFVDHYIFLEELNHFLFDQNYKELQRFIASNRYTMKIDLMKNLMVLI
jgi:hypothetical protein